MRRPSLAPVLHGVTTGYAGERAMDAEAKRSGIEQLAGVRVAFVAMIGRDRNCMRVRHVPAGVADPVFQPGPLAGEHRQQQQRGDYAAQQAGW